MLTPMQRTARQKAPFFLFIFGGSLPKDIAMLMGVVMNRIRVAALCVFGCLAGMPPGALAVDGKRPARAKAPRNGSADRELPDRFRFVGAISGNKRSEDNVVLIHDVAENRTLTLRTGQRFGSKGAWIVRSIGIDHAMLTLAEGGSAAHGVRIARDVWEVPGASGAGQPALAAEVEAVPGSGGGNDPSPGENSDLLDPAEISEQDEQATMVPLGPDSDDEDYYRYLSRVLEQQISDIATRGPVGPAESPAAAVQQAALARQIRERYRPARGEALAPSGVKVDDLDQMAAEDELEEGGGETGIEEPEAQGE